MASIHKKASGKYEVRYREAGRNRSRTFPTKEQAKHWARTVELAAYPIPRAQDVPTLEEFAAEWLLDRTDLAESTQTQYAGWLRHHILPTLGGFPLTDENFRPKRMNDWQKQALRDGAGPAVLGKAQTLLSQILDSAVLPHEYLTNNPLASLKRPRYQRKEHRWLDAGQVEQLRLWFKDRGDLGSATLISVLAYVGIRPQDALALEWTDLRGERLSVTKKNIGGKIVGGSKTGRRYLRTVWVPEMVARDLAEWKAALGDSTLIFPNQDGQPWTKANYNNWRSRQQVKDGRPAKIKCLKLAGEEVGIGWSLKPYDLRHTAATMLIAAGHDHTFVARQLGHSPAVSLTTYQHLYDEAQAGERKSMDDYIREARGIASRSLFVRRNGQEIGSAAFVADRIPHEN